MDSFHSLLYLRDSNNEQDWTLKESQLLTLPHSNLPPPHGMFEGNYNEHAVKQNTNPQAI